MPLPHSLKNNKAFQLPKRSSSSHEISIPKPLKILSSFTTTKSAQCTPNSSPPAENLLESSTNEETLHKDIVQVRLALDHFLNSEIHEAEAILRPHRMTSMYYSLGYSFILYLKCVMTFQKPDMDQALTSTKHTIELAGGLRKGATGWMESITSWVKGMTVEDIKNMTVIQRHAELVYAESYLLKAMLSILYDESVMSFLRESLNIRSSYNSYMMLEKYINNSSSTENDDDFTSGVALGVGCFSLILSMLPASVVKVAEFIGFTSDREHGLDVLASVGGWSSKNSTRNHGLRRDFCDMILITYHIVLSKIIPLSHVDEGLAVTILNDNLARYPNGVFFLYLNGRAKMSDRLLDEAKAQHQKAIDTQEDWKQLHHMCYWELGLISLIEGDFKESVRIYDLLGNESNWSKAVYCYLKSVALYMLAVNDEEQDEKKQVWMKEAEASMSKVTSEKKKIAGKSIPMEKFMSRKSRKFLSQGNYLLLADLEVLNALTAFDFMPVTILKDNLKRIQLEIDRLEKLKVSDDQHYYDDLCLSYYLRAITSRMLYPQDPSKMKAIHQASVSKVFEHAEKIQLDHYIYYFTCYENARMELLLYKHDKDRNHLAVAEFQIQVVLKANDRHQYGIGAGVHARNKYSLASALVFKCHNCMAQVKDEMDENRQ
ncbi:hypothetical protein K501DRAFT_247391, partial [Backusella circina FSU 941]